MFEEESSSFLKKGGPPNGLNSTVAAELPFPAAFNRSDRST
jgi:hypothetical protein